ncbi:hypothetical protein N7471_000230 [Penicillium samsonianum]|uniref:uncharacterized protein n=1 Tax=Penicillium samsonianum TaxID=1882272 RepID=UPI00254988EC|nr:uncharacterized protein N7471_000230 [Penicillium samsonianum]KAJ6149031.1 hypothetical protein N7471_000230 [Penicillium samsonianum]
MPRSKKTVALKAVSESGEPQSEIQTDKIHRFPVIEQSLELMKITLHMTIASLLFMRGLLPTNVFSERILRSNRFHERCNYSHFVNGKSKGNFARNRSEYVPIWVIERHMSDEADQLLDLLENGIFDALLRGVLYAVQFTVIANKDSPNKVLESYTFTFQNSGERGTADRLTNGPRMDFVSPHDDRANMRNMIFDGKALIRRLRTMCAESPALPNERSLGIHVFYKPECPGPYDMPGFVDSQDDTIKYPRTSYWERTRRFYGSVDSGFHTVGLRVNSLLSTSPGGEAHFPSAEEADDHAVLRSDEVGIPTPAQMPLDVVGEIYVFTDDSTASDTDDAVLSKIELKALYYMPAAAASIGGRANSRESRRYTENRVEGRIFFKQEDVESCQSWMHKKAQSVAESVEADLGDFSETDLLRKMDDPDRSRKSMVPFNWSQEEDYATFPISREGIYLSMARQESRKNFSPPKYIRRLQDAGSKPTVKARTLHYVENRQGAVKKLDEENKKNQPGSSGGMTKYGHKDWRHYRCECNTWNFKPSKSVQCANCKDWQHTLCYGYYSAKDKRIPDIHYCYSCLIGYDFDGNLMKELIKLIRMRRAVQFVLIEGVTPTLNWHLAAHLNCSDDEARAAVHGLRKLGILKSADMRKMKKYHKTGSSKFWLNRTIPSCNTIYSEILDPMLLIREYYEISPPIPQPLIRSHWSRSGIPILYTHMSESAEWYETIDPRWQPKLWERVRSNPSANGYFFEGQTSNSVWKRMLDSLNEEGIEDDVVSRGLRR